MINSCLTITLFIISPANKNIQKVKETEEMEKFTEGKESTVLSEVAGKVFSRVIVVFTCIILVVFPLYYENYYFNILKAKYKFYWITVLAMIVVCILLGVVFRISSI